ncbi:MAG: hypothetical protein ACT4NT_02770 [Nitrososphaerota archaeon]
MRDKILGVWNFTKTNLVMLAACFVFNPFNAFAITSKAQSIYDVQYNISNNSGDTTPILIMGCILFAVLFAYYKATNAGRHDSISKCGHCGKTIRGPRCLTCPSKKQPQE